jgi:hypothetical protein
MATSGTVGTTSLETVKVAEQAFLRSKIAPQVITSEMLARAQDHLWRILSSLPNQVQALWTQEVKLVSMPLGQAAISMPTGTVDVLDVQRRELTRHSSNEDTTATSSAAGTAANAIDEDLDTVCTQTSSNGSLKLDLSEAKRVDTWGFCSGDTESLTLTLSSSEDDSTYTTRDSVGAKSYTSGVIEWREIDPSIEARYWKVTESGGATLTIKEFIVARRTRDIPLGAINHTQYRQLPDRAELGTPLQYWRDKQASGPVLRIWKTADEAHQWDALVIHRERMIHDVGELTDTLELPDRWYDAVCTDLALRVNRYEPAADKALLADIAAERAVAWAFAQASERDQSVIQMNYDLSAYN